MNFVHFPKLNEYALEPELVREPSEYDQDVKTSGSRLAVAPRASRSQDGRSRRRSLKDKHTGGDQLPVEPAGDTTQGTPVSASGCPSKHFGELDQGGDDRNDTLDESKDGNKTTGHCNLRTPFFRRYDGIPLPQEGLDLSYPADDKGKHIKSSQMMTPVTHSGIQATTGSGDVNGPTRLTVPEVPSERQASRGTEPDQGPQQGPRGTHPADLLIQTSTNTTARSALKGTTLKSNTSKSRSVCVFIY